MEKKLMVSIGIKVWVNKKLMTAAENQDNYLESEFLKEDKR